MTESSSLPGGTFSGGILNVYAHPDDESFGNPGTNALYAGRGAAVSLICLTHGEAGETNGVCAPDDLGEVRAGELRAACAVLGIRRLELWDYPDGGLADVDDEEAIGRLMAAYA
ncbi:MAG: PIG-L family deacetylase, partial [Nitrospinota bacterium]|nr:PIG-L family deacetylase [Nitrospinota bacterium]